MLYAFRHGLRDGTFLSSTWQALRHGPLRRENVVNPRRWPEAWVGMFRGVAYGWRNHHWHKLE